MSSRAVGLIGDIHGIPDEFEELIEWFLEQGIHHSRIWILGDLVDRGPDSGKIVRICREKGIHSIMGNHDQSIVNRWDAKAAGKVSKHPNEDKENTISQLTADDVAWMRTLPPIHIFDDLRLVLVHGGVWPRLPFYAQPKNIIRAQMIQPDNPGPSKWWGPMSKKVNGFNEEEMVELGWRRWYEVYDHAYDVAFGHSVFQCPLLYKQPERGTIFGLDTGGVFGGWLTGMIHDGKGDYHLKQVKAKRIYCEDMFKQFGRNDE